MNDIVAYRRCEYPIIDIYPCESTDITTYSNTKTPYIPLTRLKPFLTALVYIFVAIMGLWLFGAFNKNIQIGLTVVFVLMLVSTLVVKIIKYF